MSENKGGAKRLIVAVAHILAGFASKNRTKTVSIHSKDYCDGICVGKINRFTSGSMPSISIHDYLVRITSQAYYSEGILVSALIYIDRIIRRQNLYVSPYELHR